MKNYKYYEHQLKYSLRKWKPHISTFIMPLMIFQGIRTFLLPSILDAALLFILILLYAGIYYSWY
ncbi:MAG: hypothetical protein K0S51_206 [Bacillales bacterium]|nr:hypothetical protein [Bacillales bacterium]